MNCKCLENFCLHLISSVYFWICLKQRISMSKKKKKKKRKQIKMMMMIIRRKELIKCLAFFVLFYGYWTQWPLENAIQSWAPFLCISILFHWEDLANIFRSWHSSWTWIHWGPRQEVILYTHTYTRVHFFFSLCRQCACSCIHLMIMMMVCRLHMRKKEKEWDVPVMGCLVAFHDSSLSFISPQLSRLVEFFETPPSRGGKRRKFWPWVQFEHIIILQAKKGKMLF